MSLNEFNTSPVTESRWIYVNDPIAFANGEFKSRGVAHTDKGATYSISHVYDLDNPEHVAFINHIKELESLALEQAKSERKNNGKKLSFVSGIKELNGEDAGKVMIKFKTKAAAQDGSAKVVFNPVQTQFNSSIYLSLFLIGVQIVNLVEVKSGMGFNAQSGGFKEKVEDSSDNLASLIEKSSDNPAY